MSNEYNYDEDGRLWPFFAFTLTTMITLPATYSLLTKTSDPVAVAPRIQTDYRTKHADTVDTQRKKEKRKNRRLKLTIAVILGWIVMAYTLYVISYTTPAEDKRWNPYDILGIEESATEKQIKSVYKQLGKKYHPDKIKPDASKNETKEILDARYVEISKAYQALTDEVTRNNYIQFGHPDGKQSFSIGIALPKLMVSDGNGKYVILFYFLLFGVGLPYIVGSWWYGKQRHSKEGVLVESANRLFRAYDDEIDEAGVLTALSEGKEFEEALKGDKAESGLAKIESRILADGQTLLDEKNKETLQDLDTGVRRKALALLWAYLGRVDLDDASLEASKAEAGVIAQSLTKSFTAIALAYGNTIPILSSYYASQRAVQALPPKASPLLQLPHITPEIAKTIEAESRIPFTVQKFMDQPDAKRRSLAVGKGLLSEQQYKTVVSVARQLPYFRVAKAYFKVAGEKCIIPSSLVTLVVKGRFVPPGSEKIPEVNELDLEDIDPAEDDLDALMGRAPKKAVGKTADGKPLLPPTPAESTVSPPLAFAPYFGRDQSPKWHVFLTDSKQGKMAVPPFTFEKFDKPIFEQGSSTPTFAMQTLKAQFQAPPQAGHYTFVMHVVCDSYVGFDTKMEVTLVVDEQSKAAAMAAEDDISEPEEDSLAGIMQSQKGGAAAPRKKKSASDDDEDEESGTDEDESETSDTNTDTEAED